MIGSGGVAPKIVERRPSATEKSGTSVLMKSDS